MNVVSLLNPFSSQYHALEQFEKLTLEQKIVTVAITLLATVASLFIASTAVFRALVGHFYTVIHPEITPAVEILPGLLPNSKRPKLVENVVRSTGNKKPVKKVIEKKTEIPPQKTAGQKQVKTDVKIDSEVPGENSLNQGKNKVDEEKEPSDSPQKTLGAEEVKTGEEKGPEIPVEVKTEITPALRRQVEKTRKRARSLDSSQIIDRIAAQRARDMAAVAHIRLAKLIKEGQQAKEDPVPAIPSEIDDEKSAVNALSRRGVYEDTSSEKNDIATLFESSSNSDEIDAPLTNLFPSDPRPLGDQDNQKQDQILSQLKGLGETSPEEQKMLESVVREELEAYDDAIVEDSNPPLVPLEDTAEKDSVEITPTLSTSSLFASVIDKKQERETLGLESRHCNMAAYIIHYLDACNEEGENETKLIQNTDRVAFQNGKIVKASDDIAALKGHHHLFHFLKETFGTSLAAGIFKRYGLYSATAVTLKDIKKAMIAIASRVTENDLKMLFEHIRIDKPGELTSYRAGDLLYQIDRELYLKIKAKKTFNQLTTDEINFLHSAFRTVSFSQLGYKGLDVVFHIKKDFVPKTVLDNPNDPRDLKAKIRDTEIDDYESFLFGKDIDALILMESWNELDLTHPELAIGEWVGKSLAYQELKPGLILPMPMIDNPGADDVSVPKLYKVAKSLAKKKDAVIAHVIAPLNEHQAIRSKGPDLQSEDVFLVFRGSMAGANVDSGMTWVRDFHYQGVGRATYDAREAEIQSMVEEYLTETASDDVTLRVTGHSLGACDSQRGLVSVLEKIAASEPGSPWRKVKRVLLTSFNAPKVNPTVNKRMKDAVREINRKGIGVEIDVRHLRFYDKSHEDHVQWGGDILLGADYHGGTGDEIFKSAANVKRTIVKVHMDEDKGLDDAGVLARHGNRTFNRALCSVPYRIETLSGQVETERMAMEKEMAGNYYWNEGEMTEGQKVINTVTWYASWFGLRQPGKVLRAVFINAPHQIALEVNRYTNRSLYERLDEARES